MEAFTAGDLAVRCHRRRAGDLDDCIARPGSGDPYRNLPHLPGYPHSEHNFAWLLEARNKRSLALDLSKPDGQAVLHRLAAEADVFITNFPPAVRGRLGMTYAELGSTRGITKESALKLALRRKWRKQDDNHGHVRVYVPLNVRSAA